MVEPLDKQAAKLIKKLRNISQVEVNRASASALNKTSQRIKTRVVRGVANSVRVPQKHIRKRVHLSRANAKKQRSKLRAYRREIPVASMMTPAALTRAAGTGTNRRGVRAVKRQFNHAFVNPVKGGRLHVLRRKGEERNPLEVVKIPIHRQVDDITPRVSRRVMKNLYPQILRHELEFRIKKYTRS